MKRLSWFLPVRLGALLLAAFAQAFAATAVPRTEPLAAFVARYATVLQGQDVESYGRLVHPRSRACIDEDQDDYYALLFRDRQYLTVRRADATFKIRPDAALAGAGHPVKPAHLIQVNLRQDESRSKVLLVQVAPHDGLWFEVISCPTPDVLRTLRAKAIEERAEVARADALASSLGEPLRSELIALLKQGKKVSAIIKYRESSGESLSIAKRVIEVLEK